MDLDTFARKLRGDRPYGRLGRIKEFKACLEGAGRLGLSKSMHRRSAQLVEDSSGGYTGVVTDKLGRKYQYVNGVRVAHPKEAKPHHLAAADKKAGRAHARAALDKIGSELAKTPRGRKLLARGRELATRLTGHVRGAVASGIKKAIDGLDEASKNGASLIIGGIKGRSPAAVAHGISQCVNAVWEELHEEIFENAMAEHSFGGAHAAGAVAGKVLGAGETAILKALALGMAKAKRGLGLAESIQGDDGELTDIDQAILDAAAKSALDALRAVYKRAGIGEASLPKSKVIRSRLARRLLGKDATDTDRHQ